MKQHSRALTLFVAAMIFMSMVAPATNVYALSKRGSTGSEVKEIQTRLKNWGYYTGSIDGVYGAKTEEAVKYFQRKNGLKVDGIAGKQTLSAMGISSSSSSSGAG